MHGPAPIRPMLPSDTLPDSAALAPGRVHEAAGPGARAFAVALAGRMAGPVLWLAEARSRETLCPQGLLPHLDPARIVIARAAGALALLQVMEEALRSGAAPLVVAELPRAADLTQSRRLQLAAGTGGGIGLCLVPLAGLGANAAETRWLTAPAPGRGAAQRWQLVKHRRGRPGEWEVRLDPDSSPAAPRGRGPRDSRPEATFP